jgi:hypothetical protein
MRRRRIRRSGRGGASVVEVAVTAPLTLLLLMGLIVGGLGAFRFQQVAHLAREGAAYASVRGPKFHKRTGQPIANSQDVLENAVLPLASGLDPAALECTCEIDIEANRVTVAVVYHWMPEALLPARTLSSTSVMPLEP